MVTLEPLKPKIEIDIGYKIPEAVPEAKLAALEQFENRTDALERIEKAEEEYKDPEERLEYGVNGFRDVAEKLERAAFRVGLYTAIKAKMRGTYGIMISGGHREKEVNGVMIVEPTG